MKNLIFVLSCLFSFSVAAQTVFSADQVVNNKSHTLLLDKSNNLPITGLVKDYYENSQLEYKMTYKDGKKDGLAKDYYENGQLKSEGTYEDGDEDGLWQCYYENGQLKSEGILILGMWNAGYWTYYYENGQLSSEGNFSDSYHEGLHKEYYFNGQLSHEIYYDVGCCDVVFEICWDESGNEITCP